MRTYAVRSTGSRWIALALSTLFLAVGMVWVSAAPAHAVSYTQDVPQGTELNAGDQIVSTNGQHKLIMQSDGNLVLYSGYNQVQWHTSTGGNPGARLSVQTDGNLVLYSATNQVLWTINKTGTSNNMLRLQGDGNLVLWANNATTAVWATYTQMNSVAAGQFLKPGWSLHGGNYALVMQGDGNLVFEVRSTHQVLWHSSTYGHPGAQAILQVDGNFVIYEGSTALWQSGTQNWTPGKVEVNATGFFALYSSAGSAYWNVGQPPGPPLTFVAPSNGTVTGFVRGSYGYCDGDARHHKGWDIAGGSTTVYAAEAGTVTQTGSGWAGTGYGPTIEISHGHGFTTWYAHLASTSVSPGQSVSKGQAIGIAGGNGGPGISYGVHLHFELRIGNTPSDVWNGYFACGRAITAGAPLP